MEARILGSNAGEKVWRQDFTRKILPLDDLESNLWINWSHFNVTTLQTLTLQSDRVLGSRGAKKKAEARFS